MRFYSVGRLFWDWIRKRPHYRPKMMASRKWTKQFCWLCPTDHFFCTFCAADSPQDMRSKKHCTSSICRLFAFCSQISSLGCSQVLRQSEDKSCQVELSIQRRNLLLSIRHQGWMGIHITLDDSWFSLSTDQIMRWSGCQMETRSPIKRNRWFRARNWC
jgi:hypothetical protein